MKKYLGLIVGVGLLFVGRYAAAEEPAVQLTQQYLQANAPPKEDDEVHHALASPTSLAFVDTPLSEIAAYFQTRHGVEIDFDRSALDDVGLSPDYQLTLTAEGISLQSALRFLLGQVELTYVVDQGRLLITTSEQDYRYSKVEFYPCADLIYDGGDQVTDAAQPNYDVLIDLIRETVDPESWSHIGGAMEIYRIENGIIVRQSDEAHATIAALLRALRTAKALPSDAYDPTPIDAVDPVEAVQLQKLRDSLDKVGSAAFVDTPLTEVAVHLSQLTGSQVLFDKRTMENHGLSPDLLVNVDFPKASARLMFDHLTHAHELTAVLDYESILITSEREVESHMIIKVYPVRDLLQFVDPSAQLMRRLFIGCGFEGGGGAESADQWRTATDRLVDSIKSTIRPESWNYLGGPGALKFSKIADALVILQTEQNHEKIAQLLYDIRTKRQLRPEISQAAKAQQTEPILIRYPIPLDDVSDNAITKLAKLLTLEVAAESWDDETQYVTTLGKTTLLVKHSPETHAKVRQWLAQLYPDSAYAKQHDKGAKTFGESETATVKVKQDAVKSGM